MNTKKSNILYTLFLCVCVFSFAFFIFFGVILSKRNYNYTEDYNIAMKLNNYKIKMSNAIYTTDTHRFIFTFSVLAESSADKAAFPYISEVRSYDKNSRNTKYLPEYIHLERNNISEYISVENVAEDFIYMAIYATSTTPEYQDSNTIDEFGDEVPGEIHPEESHTVYCTIDRRDVKFMTAEEAKKLTVPQENESEIDDSSDDDTSREYDEVTITSSVKNVTVPPYTFTTPDTQKASTDRENSQASSSGSSASDSSSSADHGGRGNGNGGGGGGNGGGGGYYPEPEPETTTTASETTVSSTAPSETPTPSSTTPSPTTTIPSASPPEPITTPAQIHPDTIRIESDFDNNLIKLTVGNETILRAIVLPDNASIKDVVWSSNKPEIAEVDGSGRVKALSKGKAIITAQTVDRGLKASCMVTVE